MSKKDIRHTNEYRKWRKAVLALHGNKCVLCGSSSLINVHHILPKKIYHKYILDVANGLPLCYHCHRSVHLIGYDFSRFITNKLMLKTFKEYQKSMTNKDGSYNGFDIRLFKRLKKQG